MTYKTAVIFIFIGSILFSTGYIGTVIGLQGGLSALEVITGRMLLASVILHVIFRDRIKKISRHELYAGIFIGVAAYLSFAFQVWGLMHTTTSINAFVTSTYVVLVPFVHYFHYKKAPDKYSNIGALLTLIGVGFISLNDGMLILSIGITLTFICAIFTAVQIFYLEVYTKKYDPITLTVVMLSTCFVMGLILTLGSYAVVEPFTPNWQNIGAMVYLGIVCTIIPFLLQNIGQKYVAATKASLIMATESIFATILAVILFNEVLNFNKFFGFFLIFFAIVVAETKLKFGGLYGKR